MIITWKFVAPVVSASGVNKPKSFPMFIKHVFPNFFEFTTGKRGNENVINDGQRYILNRKRHSTDGVERSYWICTVSGCKARFVFCDQGWRSALYTTMSTKRIVAQTLSGVDFESRAKLGCQLNCLGKMVRSFWTAANRHPPYTAYCQENDSNTSPTCWMSSTALETYPLTRSSVTTWSSTLYFLYKFASTLNSAVKMAILAPEKTQKWLYLNSRLF